MPSVMSYLSATKQSQAASAGSVMMFLCFASASVSISVSVLISDAIGIAYFFLIMAGLSFFSFLWVLIVIFKRLDSKSHLNLNGGNINDIEYVEEDVEIDTETT